MLENPEYYILTNKQRVIGHPLFTKPCAGAGDSVVNKKDQSHLPEHGHGIVQDHMLRRVPCLV